MGLDLDHAYKILQVKYFNILIKKKHTDSESSLSRNLADPLEKIVQGSRVQEKQQEHTHHA